MPTQLPITDLEIGANVRALRASFFQGSVAEAMMTRGHTSWNQTTMSSIERGRRALKMNEALTLAEILQCRVEDFLRR